MRGGKRRKERRKDRKTSFWGLHGKAKTVIYNGRPSWRWNTQEIDLESRQIAWYTNMWFEAGRLMRCSEPSATGCVTSNSYAHIMCDTWHTHSHVAKPLRYFPSRILGDHKVKCSYLIEYSCPKLKRGFPEQFSSIRKSYKSFHPMRHWTSTAVHDGSPFHVHADIQIPSWSLVTNWYASFLMNIKSPESLCLVPGYFIPQCVWRPASSCRTCSCCYVRKKVVSITATEMPTICIMRYVMHL